MGEDILLLRNLDGDPGWEGMHYQNGDIFQPNIRPDLAGAVDVGMIMSRWRAPETNVQGVFDYVHFATPSNIDDCYVEDLASLENTQNPTPTPPPPIETLSDEFMYSSTLESEWTDLYPDLHEAFIRDGALTVTFTNSDPDNVWFNSDHGTFIYKRLSGDFVAETFATLRIGDDDVPVGWWVSLSY